MRGARVRFDDDDGGGGSPTQCFTYLNLGFMSNELLSNDAFVLPVEVSVLKLLFVFIFFCC